MQQKIAELTERIYNEGVEKGEAKAREIVADAQRQADQIVADARAEAERLVTDAGKQAEELKRNVHAEIRLSGSMALSTIRQQIVDVILAQAVDRPLSQALLDVETVKEMLISLVRNWQPGGQETPGLEVLLPQARQAEFSSALRNSIGDLLSKGLQVQFSSSIKAGFQIRRQGSTYKISFTDEDFIEFFRAWVRPQTNEFLFGK